MNKIKKFSKKYICELNFLICGFIIQVFCTFTLFIVGFDWLGIISLMIASSIVGTAITLIYTRARNIVTIDSELNGDVSWRLNSDQFIDEYYTEEILKTMLLILVWIHSSEYESGTDLIAHIFGIIDTFSNVDDYYEVDYINRTIILREKQE